MKVENFSLSWIDFAVAVLLLVGVWRGRRRGMSEELLDIIKWALIVVVAGLAYQPCAHVLMSFTSVFSPLSMYVATYMALAIIIAITFGIIRKKAGAKLIGSDAFGASEYYLGMLAGAFRYGCIIIVGLAFLHAPLYTPEQLKAKAKYQQDNFGTTFFLTVPDLQQQVFKLSLSGKLIEAYLQPVLIKPTPGGGGEDLAGKDNVARARERSVNSSLDLR
jgi:uncharacterized membrane protein required for colicin V production